MFEPSKKDSVMNIGKKNIGNLLLYYRLLSYK